MSEPTEVEQAAEKKRIRAALDVLESYYDESTGKIDGRRMMNEIAALKHQHDMLLEALEAFSEYVHAEQCATDGHVTYSAGHITALAFKARAAIAAVEGEK